VIKALPGLVDQVLVVDWRSTDGTPARAEELGARVIHEDRKGYGQAYLTGIPEAEGDLVITLDADGTYPAHLIPELIDRLLDEDRDFLSCCRFPLEHLDAMPLANRSGNRLLRRVANTLFGIQLRDLLSGMWVFRREAWARLSPTSTNWNMSQEIKLRAAIMLGARFAEAWIPYSPRIGQTKLMPMRVGAENLAHLFVLRHQLGRGTGAPGA
jgi:glycosyltransferase involved in cell wall biosynthesis